MHLTHRVEVSALVLSAVRGVAEGLEAASELAAVRPLPGVGALVDLQVLQARERLGAAGKLERKMNNIVILVSLLTIAIGS